MLIYVNNITLLRRHWGKKLGIINKTVSRWGNANYMPDIEMLQLLSKELNVSVNELLPFVFDRSWLVGLVPLLALVEYGYQNNQMMAYVEHCLYD